MTSTAPAPALAPAPAPALAPAPAPAPAAAAQPVADQNDELFDVVNELNEPVGTATRAECHAEGLLHRSTHIFLFRRRAPLGGAPARAEVLLQRRAAAKKVGPGLWDVSVAEHLSAGEGYAAATVRGLREELRVALPHLDIVKVRGPYLSKQAYPDAAVLDYMFTCCFAAVWEGAVEADAAEVADARWWAVDDVVRTAREEPALFTRWMLIELRNMDLAEVARQALGEM